MHSFRKKERKKWQHFPTYLYKLLLLLNFQTANLVFFVLTSRKLYETWRLTKANLDTNEFRVSPRAQRNSNNFKVIFKIFVIMGVTWFSELFGFILSWICGRDKVWKYFVLNDIINLLQGVLIFIVLICKPSVMGKWMPEMPSCFLFGSKPKTSSRKHKISVCTTVNTKDTSLAQ